MNPVRLNITIPAADIYEPRDLQGYAVYVANAPDALTAMDLAPTLHFDEPDSDGLRLTYGATFRKFSGFKRLWIRGRGTAGTVTLVVFTMREDVCSAQIPGNDAAVIQTAPALNTFIWYADVGNVGLHKAPLDGGEIPTLISAGGYASADYGWRTRKLYGRTAGDIHELNIDGTGATAFGLALGANSHHLRVYDGRKVVTTRKASGGVAGGIEVIDIETGTLEATYTAPDANHGYTDVAFDENFIYAIRWGYGANDTATAIDWIQRFTWDLNTVENVARAPDAVSIYIAKSITSLDLDTLANEIYFAYAGRLHKAAKDAVAVDAARVNGPYTSQFGQIPRAAGGAAYWASDHVVRYDPVADNLIVGGGDGNGTGHGGTGRITKGNAFLSVIYSPEAVGGANMGEIRSLNVAGV